MSLVTLLRKSTYGAERGDVRVLRSTGQGTRIAASSQECLLVKDNATIFEQCGLTERVHVFHVLPEQQSNFTISGIIFFVLVFNARSN